MKSKYIFAYLILNLPFQGLITCLYESKILSYRDKYSEYFKMKFF